jgi:hypothetical protein
MNERWKDLIKQAIQEIGPEDNPSKEETLKRYAELIVQECVKIAYQNDVAKFTRDGYVIGQEIEKHFGVEE